jgi:DNA recombination-mediator protein A
VLNGMGEVIFSGDPEWPTQLDDLEDGRPLLLWVQGRADLRYACLSSVSLVGSRAVTAYGSHVGTELSAALTERGFSVVSGGPNVTRTNLRCMLSSVPMQNPSQGGEQPAGARTDGPDEDGSRAQCLGLVVMCLVHHVTAEVEKLAQPNQGGSAGDKDQGNYAGHAHSSSSVRRPGPSHVH